MLDPSVLQELAKLKTEEVLKINNYIITVKMLTLKDIIECSDEYRKISTEKDLATIITVGLNLINRTIVVKDTENNNIEFGNLPIPISMNAIEVWLTLNFMSKDQIIQPLERAIEKITGKKVDLKKILASFSSLLSNVDTVPETKSLS